MAHDVAPDPLAGLNIDVQACLKALMADQPPPEPDPRVQGLTVLAAFCQEHRLTQRKLAGMLGCVHSHAGRILRGESKISFEHALAFERATGVRAAEVLGLQQERSIATKEGTVTDEIPPLGRFTA